MRHVPWQHAALQWALMRLDTEAPVHWSLSDSSRKLQMHC